MSARVSWRITFDDGGSVILIADNDTPREAIILRAVRRYHRSVLAAEVAQ